MQLSLASFDQFRAAGPFPSNYEPGYRRLYTQDDDVHGALKLLLSSVGQNGAKQASLSLMMFGYDDDELNQIILGHLADPKVLVEVSLDKSQSGGVHEKALLAADTAYVGNSIAIGTSAFGSQISHEKGLVVDDRWTIGGSTNWSMSGEGDGTKKQNNELTIFDGAVTAAEFKTQAHAAHLFMLGQMANAAKRAAVEASGVSGGPTG